MNITQTQLLGEDWIEYVRKAVEYIYSKAQIEVGLGKFVLSCDGSKIFLHEEMSQVIMLDKKYFQSQKDTLVDVIANII